MIDKSFQRGITKRRESYPPHGRQSLAFAPYSTVHQRHCRTAQDWRPMIRDKISPSWRYSWKQQKCIMASFKWSATYPDNDLLRDMGTNDETTAVCMRGPNVSLQGDHQHEVPLVRVGFPLLAHVVGGRLAEVEPTHGQLAHLVRARVKPTREQCLLNLCWVGSMLWVMMIDIKKCIFPALIILASTVGKLPNS